MWTSNKIRQTFLDYFANKNHTIVASSPLVPHNDPSLMFVAAGMVPFKNLFTGLEKRNYVRATSSQKCVRAGGKHNDLENVGYTARHHTFFEMLGNFSFGDYFKEQAIAYAWELVTTVFNIPADRLLVTVYHEDQEAVEIWKRVAHLPDEKIIRIATTDNFWSMGDTGPCGPCSEIFYDHGAHIPGGPPGSPNEDGDRFVEIWNLVFMQYEQLEDGTRINLPNPSIDTGAGLERLAAVLQGVHNNYDTDIFKTLIAASADLTGASLPTLTEDALVSHRVIADHLRASCFLLADGISPSNEGRGYVLRRIMRRAMRHAYLLGAKEPLMHHLVPSLVEAMGEAFPELIRAKPLMVETLRLEEERFRQTLGRGLKLLEEEMHTLTTGQNLSGEIAFKLYDTYGFPLDLTQDILRSHHISVDGEGFNKAMQRQKDEARKSWIGSGATQDDTFWFNLAQTLPATEFLGYDATSIEGQVLALIQDGQHVNQVSKGAAQVLLNQTPFYAESGGQISDQGILTAAGLKADVINCHKKAGTLFVHDIRIQEGTLHVGDAVGLVVNGLRRDLIRANHSATHLLHAVLRKHLGEQVVQKGSLVAPDRLRFDFSYGQALSSEALIKIEDEVNFLIRRNTPTETKIMIPNEALKTGAVALFGEKYGEEVRVVAMGLEDVIEKRKYSIEFCGGTHVNQTGDIGYFKIISESGVAAGIRRIEALTGPAAEAYTQTLEGILHEVAGRLKTKPEHLAGRVESVLEERKKLEREVQTLKDKLNRGTGTKGQEIKEVNGIKFLAKTLENAMPRDLKPAVDQFKKDLGSGVVVLGASIEGKGSLVVGVTADLTARLNAVDLVRIGSEALGGAGGGGRPDLAQAGGPEGSKLAFAYAQIETSLAGSLV